MSAGKGLELEEIRAALAELDELSRGEYEIGFEQVLLDDSPTAAVRVQRLTGIALKRHFAEPGDAPQFSHTGALRSWPWKDASPEASAGVAPRELAILNQLRMPGPWNERKPRSGTADDLVPITWEELKDDADQERGLFKVLALYVDDKLEGRDRRSLREYLEAPESRRFEAGVDLATLLFDAAVIAPLAGVVGVPTLAVGIGLVGIQYGYRRLTDTQVERVGDRVS